MVLFQNKKLLVLAFLSFGWFFITQPSVAQTRFTLSKIDNGYILLNQETGALSICTKEGEELICDAASSDQQAGSKEVADTKANETQNLSAYFTQFFSATLKEKGSAFYAELTKRLYKMVDDIKTPYKRQS